MGGVSTAREVLLEMSRRPSALAALTVVSVCVPVDLSDFSAAVHVSAADVASAALVAVAAATAVRGRRLPPCALLLIPILLAVTVATLWSGDPHAGLPGFVRFAQVFVLVPLSVAEVLRDRYDMLSGVAAIVTVALVQGAVGSWQSLTGTGASYAGQQIRAVGTFGSLDVMGMATVTSYGLIMALAVGLASRGRLRVAALSVAAFLTVPLVLSLSRGTWLALLCAVGVMLLLYSARLALWAAVLVPVGLVVLAAWTGTGLNVINERVSSLTSSVSDPDRSVTDRYALWQSATAMWQDHPVTGVGPRGFAAWRDSYAPLRLSSGSDTDDPGNGFHRQPLLSPHNMYLLVLSEQGLLGLTAFALFLALVAMRTLWHPLRRRPLGLAAIGFVTWQATDFLYSDIGGTPTLVMSVMLGITLRLASHDPSGTCHDIH
jgi:O-antigen ligase